MSTPLELFVDLCFVVAVAQAASSLHHALAEDHVSQALIGYPTVFFAIWWAWVNFTWFASAYDDDSVVYRIGVFVQVAGILILAAGVPRAFADEGFGVVILGYVIMRLGLVSLWLLAGRGDPDRRRTTLRYAVGIVIVQLGWIGLVWVPAGLVRPVFLLLVVCDIAVPVIAERAGVTPWHPGHIAERYGLFTIIVLGESILAITLAVQTGLDGGEAIRGIFPVAIGGFLAVCAMWWMYFAQPIEGVVDHARHALEDGPSREPFIWGYGHYVIFGSVAAVGAGYAVAVDASLHASNLPAQGVSLSVAIPIALYVVSVWALHARSWAHGPARAVATFVLAGAILVAGVLAAPVIASGLLLAVGVVCSEVVARVQANRDGAEVPTASVS